MTSLAWPVCDLIFSVDTPACTALVEKPARRLWPAARKLLLEFMREQEAREANADAKAVAEGEDIASFSWNAAKEELYDAMKAAGRLIGPKN